VSFDGTIKDNLGFAIWRTIEVELLRVASRVLFLGYTNPQVYRVSDAVTNPEEFARNTIILPGGHLVYRPGQDGSCEVYDLLVEEDQRRQGIGSRLVQELFSHVHGTLYGFTQQSNEVAQRFYRSRGFSLTLVPNLYRGGHGVMFTKRHLPGD
jgi:ribosomal protein S18 acetylase RimI-like enzyme